MNIVVTVIELPSCKHLEYIEFEMPSAWQKGGYRQVISFNSFFHGWSVKSSKSLARNKTKTRLYHEQRKEEWDLFKWNYFAKSKRTKVKDLWDFYRHIGYDWRTKKHKA